MYIFIIVRTIHKIKLQLQIQTQSLLGGRYTANHNHPSLAVQYLLMKELSTHELKKILNSHLIFEPQKYNQTENKKQYLQDLISYMIIKQRLNPQLICLNEMNDIFKQLGFALTIQQMHELYLFSTFDTTHTNRQKATVKQKLLALVNQERKKADIDLMVEWLIKNMSNLRISNTNKMNTNTTYNNSTKKRADSEQKPKTGFKEESFRLPALSNSKLENELQPLIETFDEMEKLRQSSGLIPMKLDQDEQDMVEVPFMNIPYDPQLYVLNQNLTKLRIKAEGQLKRIIELAREDPEIRKKLEAGIYKFQKSRIETNQKIGRAGAINAQRRLAEQRNKELNKLKSINLGAAEDLTRAARVYSLLNMPSPKIKPVY